MPPFLHGRVGMLPMPLFWHTTVSLPFVNNFAQLIVFMAYLKAKTGHQIVRSCIHSWFLLILSIKVIPDYAKFMCGLPASWINYIAPNNYLQMLRTCSDTSWNVWDCQARYPLLRVSLTSPRRTRNWFFYRAAALATGCEVKIDISSATFDLRQNQPLGKSNLAALAVTNFHFIAGGEVANIVLNKYGDIDYEWGIKSASTDFVSFDHHTLFSAKRLIFFTGKCILWFASSNHLRLQMTKRLIIALPSLHPGFGKLRVYASIYYWHVVSYSYYPRWR